MTERLRETEPFVRRVFRVAVSLVVSRFKDTGWIQKEVFPIARGGIKRKYFLLYGVDSNGNTFRVSFLYSKEFCLVRVKFSFDLLQNFMKLKIIDRKFNCMIAFLEFCWFYVAAEN